ncbi:MAG: FAD-dependent oxidoreductase [Rhodanobacteraceae bacterium]|nr:FAD-dependent oxidoreductase [Rhodanobacteraceae bacterium]
MSSTLFEKGSIGKLEIKNRLVLPPMLMGYSTVDGYVTQRMKDYYDERAKGGVGMVVVEAAGVRFEGKVFPFSVNCYDESHLPGLTELANAIKRHGARAAIQLGDGGRNTRRELTGAGPVAPSPVATHKRDQPRVLTVEDIKGFVNLFANSIRLGKQAGFEGAEIHAGHVYFLNQFLSAHSNMRTDEYGGSVEKRARIIVEIIQEARKLVGPDYPVWIRVNAEEPGDENGITIEQTMQIAQIAERAGYDAISLTSGGSHYEASMGSTYFAEGFLTDFAARIKQVVSIPVIVVGRIDARLAEQVLRSGKADFIAMGRGLMVDPELPIKAQEGRFDEIMPCTACMNCVHRGVLRDTPITCQVNPALGREAESRLLPAARKSKVVVVGAGPAGLEAARVAATRGHMVTVLEAAPQVGGRFRLLAAAPHKEPIRGWIEFMGKRLRQLGVDVRLDTQATAVVVQQLAPEAVILATGLASVQRSDQGPRQVGQQFVHLQDVLSGRASTGEKVLILGDDTMAAECADLLSERGKVVTVIVRGKRLAPEMLAIIRNVLLKRLAAKKVTQVTESRANGIGAGGVEVVHADGRLETLAADTVVLGNDFMVDPDFLSAIGGLNCKLYVVGGGRNIADAQDAIADAFGVARMV